MAGMIKRQRTYIHGLQGTKCEAGSVEAWHIVARWQARHMAGCVHPFAGAEGERKRLLQTQDTNVQEQRLDIAVRTCRLAQHTPRNFPALCLVGTCVRSLEPELPGVGKTDRDTLFSVWVRVRVWVWDWVWIRVRQDRVWHLFL